MSEPQKAKIWWMKVLGVFLLIVLAGAVYEAVSLRLTVSKRDVAIQRYLATNRSLLSKLAVVNVTVEGLKSALAEGERASADLATELERSRRIADGISAENRRLGGILSRGSEAAGALGEDFKRLGESIDQTLRTSEELERRDRER